MKLSLTPRVAGRPRPLRRLPPSCLVLFPDPMRRSHIIVVGVVQIVATPLSEAQGPGKDGIINYIVLPSAKSGAVVHWCILFDELVISETPAG